MQWFRNDKLNQLWCQVFIFLLPINTNHCSATSIMKQWKDIFVKNSSPDQFYIILVQECVQGPLNLRFHRVVQWYGNPTHDRGDLMQNQRLYVFRGTMYHTTPPTFKFQAAYHAIGRARSQHSKVTEIYPHTRLWSKIKQKQHNENAQPTQKLYEPNNSNSHLVYSQSQHENG